MAIEINCRDAYAYDMSTSWRERLHSALSAAQRSGVQIVDMANETGISDSKLYSFASKASLNPDDMRVLEDYLARKGFYSREDLEGAQLARPEEAVDPVEQAGMLLHNISVMLRNTALPMASRLTLLKANAKALIEILPALEARAAEEDADRSEDDRRG
jgi:hypothetical protein